MGLLVDLITACSTGG